MFLNDSDLVPARVQMIDNEAQAPLVRAQSRMTIRARQQAAGSRGRTQKEGFGRSRLSGGKTVPRIVFRSACHFTTEIHLRANGAGLPMRSKITGGETADAKGVGPVMAKELPDPAHFLAGKGCDADKIREKLEERRIAAVIPMRRNRREWRAVDRGFHRWRNLVERCFSKLKQWRRVATRHDKTALGFLGFIDVASVRIWLRFLST